MTASAPTNKGTIVSVRGSVVDVRFKGRLPSIYSVLRAGGEKEIVIEVLAQLLSFQPGQTASEKS